MVDKTKLQISDPLEFCSANNISYKGLNVYLLDTTKAADVAMILYKVANASHESSRWGHIYFGCTLSRLFPDISVENFWELWQSVFSNCSISFKAFQAGVGVVNKARQKISSNHDPEGKYLLIFNTVDTVMKSINHLTKISETR